MHVKYGQNSHIAADLVNLKTRGFLMHPSHQMFHIIKCLESSFIKFADSFNVFEETYEDFFKNEDLSLKWECSDHKTDIFTNVFTLFITMRMRQYSYAKNINSKKLNRTKKKLSKLVSS